VKGEPVIGDLLIGWADLQASLPRYEEAEEYFEGTVDEVFTSERIRQAIAETGERYRFNLVKTPVQVMCDRVELTSVTAPGNDQANRLIEQVWDANDMDVHFPDLLKKTFTSMTS
jgi:hypothetical protein